MNTLFAFLKKESVPTRGRLQNAIDELGYDMQLHQAFAPFVNEGFLPCVLMGRDGFGFEIFYEPVSDLIEEDDEEFLAVAGDNDYCISMSFGGSKGDLVCASIVSLVLLQKFGAVISFEGEEPETIESLTIGLNEGLNNLEEE